MEEKRISVVINTYNEETHLEACVKAAKGFDEIVVCDMESTDGTVELARRLGCKVVTFPKANHKSAEPARTFAIQSASHPWVLVVDADEIVSPELRSYLYARIAQPDCPAGLYIPRQNHFMQRPFGYPDYQLRFFIKEGTVWPPYVHTFPQVKGRLERIPASRHELAFDHLDDDSVRTRLIKTNAYTDNEVKKKASKHYGYFHLVAVPVWWFLRSYILKGEMAKGKVGFIHSAFSAIYRFVTIAKVIESRQQGKPLA